MFSTNWDSCSSGGRADVYGWLVWSLADLQSARWSILRQDTKPRVALWCTHQNMNVSLLDRKHLGLEGLAWADVNRWLRHAVLTLSAQVETVHLPSVHICLRPEQTAAKLIHYVILHYNVLSSYCNCFIWSSLYIKCMWSHVCTVHPEGIHS